LAGANSSVVFLNNSFSSCRVVSAASVNVMLVRIIYTFVSFYALLRISDFTADDLLLDASGGEAQFGALWLEGEGR
jgi:hypothetical protein